MTLSHSLLVARHPIEVERFRCSARRQVSQRGHAIFAEDAVDHDPAGACCDRERWYLTVERLVPRGYSYASYDGAEAVEPEAETTEMLVASTPWGCSGTRWRGRRPGVACAVPVEVAETPPARRRGTGQALRDILARHRTIVAQQRHRDRQDRAGGRP